MISRRTFLGTMSVGLGTLIVSGCASNNEIDNTLPKPIAALSSMSDKVRPITVSERSQRLEHAKKLMKANKLDAILLMGGTSLDYFTGIRWGISERLLAIVITQKGNPFIVCPAFEEDRAMEQIEKGPMAGTASVLTWQEHENPYRLIVQGLRESGIVTGNVGVEETVRFVFSDGLSKETNTLSIMSATPVTAGCRVVKGENEIYLMRLASEVTLKAYTAAYNAIEVGMTQEEVGRLISDAHKQLGFSGYASVQVGKYAALPHGSTTPQVVKEGVPILIDGGCGVSGYRSDVSRTFVIGKASDKAKEVFNIVLEAQTAALNVARPGIEAQKIDAAGRKVIEDAGYGPDYKYFTHRLGHGIGMDGHEWPYLVKGNKTILKPGMTFSDEPGIYIPEEFGVRLEDELLITENGAELLTPQSYSLENPFA